MQAEYEMKMQVIRFQGRACRLFVNIPMFLAAALDIQAGERVRWQLLGRSELRLPQPAAHQFHALVRYLVEQRLLPRPLVEALTQSGDLYADTKANAVFLLRDAHGQPVGAELRGTGPVAWRGMAPGSRKDLGFFSVPALPRPDVILCESAIDAISCHVLHPKHRCLSTAGARPNPAWLPDLLDQGCRLWCGFDLDATGQAMAQAMIGLHPSIRLMPPALHDWNDVLRARSAVHSNG